MFVDSYLYLLHHKTLCDVYKERVRQGSSKKKYKALQKLGERKTTKDATVKFNLPGTSLHRRKMKKN